MEWDAGMLQVAQHNHIQIRFGLVLFVLSLRRFGMFGIRFASNLDFDAFMRESHALPASSTWRLTTSCLRSSGLDLWPCRWRQSKWSHPERSSLQQNLIHSWNFGILFSYFLYIFQWFWCVKCQVQQSLGCGTFTSRPWITWVLTEVVTKGHIVIRNDKEYDLMIYILNENLNTMI